MTDVCQICDYAINKSVRKSIPCPYCEFSACKTCCERYILSESTVKCMSPACGREWTRQHVSNVFPSNFITGKLKKHREQLLFDSERALLPATQPIVERRIKTEELEAQRNHIRNQIRILQGDQYRIQHEIWRFQNNRVPVERAEFTKPCPDSECRGFLSTQWKCGICQKWSCPHCHEIKGLERDVEHTCNPETVATVTLLSADTKPCPSCHTQIFRVSGCDEMFCTNCHTGFNWRTGRQQATMHNPHYFEWLRRNGGAVPRTPGDVPCRNELTHTVFTEIRRSLTDAHKTNQFSNSCSLFMEKLIRNALHLRHVVLPTYAQGNQFQRNEEWRIQYMRNVITEEFFKTMLQRDQKKSDKMREMHNILDILLNTATDIVFRFLNHLSTSPPGTFSMNILEEFDPIVDYANECLRDISRTYNSKQIQVSNELAVKGVYRS